MKFMRKIKSYKSCEFYPDGFFYVILSCGHKNISNNIDELVFCPQCFGMNADGTVKEDDKKC